MSGGETNPAVCIAYTIPVAVDYAGLIVTRSATAAYMDLAADASADVPEGYTYTNSKHPITGASRSGQKIGVHALIPGQKAEFVLPSTHAAIAVGDRITMTTAGCVIKYAGSGAAWILGTSEDAVDQNTGGYVEVRMNPYYLAA
jgi:hypothetical protein